MNFEKRTGSDLESHRKEMIDKVKALELPFDEYLVVGSLAMEIQGCDREANDIDILVSNGVYDYLKKLGWKEVVEPNGFVFIKNEQRPGIEIFTSLNYGNETKSFDELKGCIKNSDSIPVMSLEELRRYKEQKGREKDLKDIELIDAILVG